MKFFVVFCVVFFCYILIAGEKPFIASFPEATGPLINAANNLDEKIDNFIRVEKEVKRTGSIFKSARSKSKNKNKCCQKEGDNYIMALLQSFITAEQVGIAAKKFINLAAEDKDSEIKIAWLKKRLRKAGIDLAIIPTPKLNPSSPTVKIRRANFLIFML